jgi:hypothetical protein
MATVTTLDYRRLLQIRLTVARFGEMDRSKWWNTKGLLSGLGEMALSRGFPKSHPLARARAVFGVAAHRCKEVFDPPKGLTLWKLPPDAEEQFESNWSEWLDNIDPWANFIDKMNEQHHADLLEILASLDLIDASTIEQAKKLRRSPDGHSVPLPSENEITNESIALLAAGFFRSEPGKLAIPYIQLERDT